MFVHLVEALVSKQNVLQNEPKYDVGAGHTAWMDENTSGLNYP